MLQPQIPRLVQRFTFGPVNRPIVFTSNNLPFDAEYIQVCLYSHTDRPLK